MNIKNLIKIYLKFTNFSPPHITSPQPLPHTKPRYLFIRLSLFVTFSGFLRIVNFSDFPSEKTFYQFLFN